jgi:hypothetical protein
MMNPIYQILGLANTRDVVFRPQEIGCYPYEYGPRSICEVDLNTRR